LRCCTKPRKPGIAPGLLFIPALSPEGARYFRTCIERLGALFANNIMARFCAASFVGMFAEVRARVPRFVNQNWRWSIRFAAFGGVSKTINDKAVGWATGFFP